jgi:hypothetical protein
MMYPGMRNPANCDKFAMEENRIGRRIGDIIKRVQKGRPR